MTTIRIRNPSELQQYIDAGLVYSALKPDLKQSMYTRAIHAWYISLLKDGFTALPFGLVLDLGVRTLQQGQIFDISPAMAPNKRIFSRYTQALDVCYRDTTLRDIMSDITLHRQNAGVVLLLKQLLGPILSNAPVMAVIEPSVLPDYTLLNQTSSRKEFIEAVEQMIHHFSEYILQRTEFNASRGELLASVDRRLIQAVTRQETAMTYPDLELIERCMAMDDLPPMKSTESSSIMRSLHTIRLEQPFSRHAKPDGGFIGIRNNGGLEDLSNPVISEWANPSALLWDKLTNRNLLIYERAARTLSVHHMVIHMMMFDSADIMAKPSDSDRIPLQDIKFLLAAVARDVALYASQIRSVDVQLNIQVVTSSHSMFDVRHVSLTGLTKDMVKRRQHFLLDERDVFPWFFSTNLQDTSSWVYQDQEDDFTGIDLIEDMLPERDIHLADHIDGFENAHCFVFCTAAQFTSWRTAIVDHTRSLLDLDPSGLDSLVFVYPADDVANHEDGWRLELVHELHRNTDPSLDDSASGTSMTSSQIRDMIRYHFLARLLGNQRVSESRPPGHFV